MIYLLRDSEGKDQGVLAKELLNYGLNQEYGIRGPVELACREEGKPYLVQYPSIHFNYSHCKQGILCSIDQEETGTDIERIIPYKENLAMRICHPRELELLGEEAGKDRMLSRIWLAKESYLKYLGCGIRIDLRTLDLHESKSDAFEKNGCRFFFHMEADFGFCVCGKRTSFLWKEVTRETLGRCGIG